MAKPVLCGSVLEGIISARVYTDGSMTIEARYDGSGGRWFWEDIVEVSPKGVKALRTLLDRAAELPLEPTAQHSEAGDAPTLSGLYNCQLCGREKCSQPGIIPHCPTKRATDAGDSARFTSRIHADNLSTS